MRFALPLFCVLVACGSDPPPPASLPGSQGPSALPPTVPPNPVSGQEAFYIIEIPASPLPTTPGAKVCKSNAECDALLPPNPPTIVRRFNEESWLLISTPADHVVRKVVSDGTTATATIDQPC